MGCSFLAPVQDVVGRVADVVAPIAAAIPGPWQAPAMVYVAATTLQNGGSLEDVVKNVGKAYVLGEIGAGVSGGVGGAATEAGLEAATATTLGNVAGNVAKAAVGGGDPLAALISGGIGAGVGEITSQIPGFNDLSPMVQQSAKAAISAELQGRDPSQALISQALGAGMNAVKDYQPSMAYNFDPATNPADPNADSNPDLNGSVSDNLPAGNLPTTDYSFKPDYGLSNAGSVAGLTVPANTNAFNADGSVNYNLASTDLGSETGLQMPLAPGLSSMGGGYGFITPVTGGYMTSLGFVPTDHSQILGDPASFINDPNVLGKTVIGPDTLRAPLAGVSATSTRVSGGGGSGTGTGTSTGTSTVKPKVSGLSSFNDPTGLAGSSATNSNIEAEMAQKKLQQLYSGLTAAPTTAYSYVNDVNPTEVDVRKMEQLPDNQPYYATGGLVQHFAEGDQPVDTSTPDVMKALKSLGDLGSDQKLPKHAVQQIGQAGLQYAPKVMPQLAAILRSRGMTLAEGGQPGDQDHPHYDGTPVFRTGGLEGLGGKYVEGKGDGTSDDISAMLANGEYVFSADVVSALGNGSNKAGADRLGEMVEAIRARARSAPADKLPPDAKSPLEYLKSPKGKKHV